MFFRNLSLFRFSPAVGNDLARLEEALADHRLRACGPLEMATHGFVPPLAGAEDEPLTRSLKHCTLLALGSEDKLLPRAFVRSSRLAAYVDRQHGWVVLDTASRKAAEDALSQMRQALGSFPAVPLAPANSPRLLMTDWLSSGKLPAGLHLGDECELRDPASNTGAIVRCRRQDLEADEIKEHLRTGKQVFLLGLVFNERISFVLGEDLVVHKLKFLDVVTEELGDSQDDAMAELDAGFALMSLELAQLLAKLDECFGLPRPTDA
jgi:recombination associated protein RdgC